MKDHGYFGFYFHIERVAYVFMVYDEMNENHENSVEFKGNFI